jgi:hypothetical protein
VIDSLTASLVPKGALQGVPANRLKTKNDGNNSPLDRDTRLLNEHATRFRVTSPLIQPTTSQVNQPIQEGNSL